MISQEASNPNGKMIKKELNLFTRYVKSLKNTLPIVMEVMNVTNKQVKKRSEDFTQKYTKSEEGSNDGLWIELDQYEKFRKMKQTQDEIMLAYIVIPRSYLVSLVSQFDSFVGGLLRAVFLIKPDLLNASERNITFSQLIEFGTIDNAREHIIEKEIETVLRKSHAEQFVWMENRFDIPLRKGLDIWSKFIEITERRNLFVHTNGRVSSQYIKNCKEHEVKVDPDLKKGERLEVDPKYMREAFDVVFEISVKLAHVLWRKFLPQDRAEADESLNSICYDELLYKRYDMAKVLLDFALDIVKKHSNDDMRRTFVVNRALAYRWSGEDKKAASIMGSEDWSATANKFRLAELIMRDDIEGATAMMKRIGANDENVNVAAYKFWPLFKKIREEQAFLDAFEEIFKQPYNTPKSKSLAEIELSSVVSDEQTDILDYVI